MRKTRFTEEPDSQDFEGGGGGSDSQGGLPGVRCQQRHLLQVEVQVRRHGIPPTSSALKSLRKRTGG